MTKRKWTPEQRKAASERAKAQIAALKEKQNVSDTDSDSSGSSPSPQLNTVVETPSTVTLTQEQFQMMLDRLAAKPEPVTTPQNGPSLNSQGGVVGVVERFPVNPDYYKNPVEELYDLPQLRRFGLRENYVIDWSVTPTRYQTAMGTWYVEPRFELTLKRRQFDDNNQEVVKTKPDGTTYHPRIVMGRASFFEDPPANIIEAEQAGVSVDDLDKPAFQEKMRMYRYQFWLTEQLTPKRPRYTSNAKHEEVIGGKAYEIEEYSNPV